MNLEFFQPTWRTARGTVPRRRVGVAASSTCAGITRTRRCELPPGRRDVWIGCNGVFCPPVSGKHVEGGLNPSSSWRKEYLMMFDDFCTIEGSYCGLVLNSFDHCISLYSLCVCASQHLRAFARGGRKTFACYTQTTLNHINRY